jgi:hypothetical protein
MKKNSVRFYNRKYFPFGSVCCVGTKRNIVEQIEAEDVRIWEGKPTYVDQLQAEIDRINKQTKPVPEPGWLGVVRRFLLQK